MVLEEITLEDIVLDAVSFVSMPANEKEFFMAIDPALLQGLINNQIFKPIQTQEKYYRYSRVSSESFDTNSRTFCNHNEDKIYTERQVRNWVNLSNDEKEKNGYIKGYADNFLMNFPKFGYKMDNCFYNCRHVLTEVNAQEVPYHRKRYLNMHDEKNMNFEKVSNMYDDENQTVKGVVLIPNQFIYRRNLDNTDGYVYFKKDTIRQMKEMFDDKKKFTYGHKSLLNSVDIKRSWISENEENIKDGTWLMETHIKSKEEYERIKNLGDKAGFSIESYLKIN